MTNNGVEDDNFKLSPQEHLKKQMSIIHRKRPCSKGGPKFAKRLKMDTEPDGTKFPHCNSPGHDEPTCCFGAKMENCPPKTEAQKNPANFN